MYKRLIFDKLVLHLPKKEYTIIVGARQTGKTTILKQLYKRIKQKSEYCYFLTFENTTLLEGINENPENIFKFVERVFEKKTNKRLYLFIDEIQYAKNPTNFLKYLFDTYEKKIKIVATGSSAFYIDKNFKDSLVGRKRIFHLKHLNFEEYLHFQEREELQRELILIRANENYYSIKRKEIEYYFDEYLCFGGYPAVALENNYDEKIEILKEIRNSYLKKDAEETGINYVSKYKQLMILLAEQIGNLVNKNELANTLNIDNKTIEKYLIVSQKCFHINFIQPFYNNLRKEISKMPKVYFSDLGLRNSLINNFERFDLRQDKGQILENYVFIRFSEKIEQENLYFWRTSDQNEVDFIVKKNSLDISAYEVKISQKLVKPSKYSKFKELYPNIPLNFVDYENILNI